MAPIVSGSRPPITRTSQGSEPLTRPESIAVVVFACGSITLDLISFITAGGTEHISQMVVSIGTMLCLLLFIWSPTWAVLILGVAMSVSFLAGNAVEMLLAGSLAALLVLRTAASPFVMAYVGGLLVSSALLLSGIGTPDREPANIAIYLFFATAAGAVGMALRTAIVRGQQLETELAEREEREHQAILAERRWIAGELHDSIAHHLTIISLHVQMLDDERMRPASQQAIAEAARKALADLRFVITIAEEEPEGSEDLTGDLAEAIQEASSEFEAAGHVTEVIGDPADEGIPRGAEIILARVVRESATNIIKYAGVGKIRFVIETSPKDVTMTVRSPLPTSTPRVVSSSGTGLDRMAQRVLGVSGEFSAGPVDNEWHVVAHLPFSPSAQPSTSPLAERPSGYHRA